MAPQTGGAAGGAGAAGGQQAGAIPPVGGMDPMQGAGQPGAMPKQGEAFDISLLGKVHGEAGAVFRILQARAAA
jgi:hypothetical protein